jgi:mono/diheme cytochrome c family protein
MRAHSLLLIAVGGAFAGCGPRPSPEERAQAVAAFATVQQVLQHPRCQNCHIPGDAPLQYDAGLPHTMAVACGPEGHGAPGLPCATCHGEANAPAGLGPNAPPGAPHWGLPPPDQKMAWIGLSPAALCATVKDRKANGGRDLDEMTKHVSEDKLVLWGWNPGGARAPVSVAHGEFVAKFKQWADAGGPCPGDQVAEADARPSVP